MHARRRLVFAFGAWTAQAWALSREAEYKDEAITRTTAELARFAEQRARDTAPR